VSGNSVGCSWIELLHPAIKGTHKSLDPSWDETPSALRTSHTIFKDSCDILLLVACDIQPVLSNVFSICIFVHENILF